MRPLGSEELGRLPEQQVVRARVARKLHRAAPRAVAVVLLNRLSDGHVAVAGAALELLEELGRWGLEGLGPHLSAGQRPAQGLAPG